ncbi:MAG: DUF2968 domain-containing protein [Dyella sp.]
MKSDNTRAIALFVFALTLASTSSLALADQAAPAQAASQPNPLGATHKKHHPAKPFHHTSKKAATTLPAPAVTPAPAPAPRAVAGISPNDLRKLMDDHQLTELRTTYNSNYGTSLLFQTDKLSYYVALFHDKVFLRAVQTDSFSDADAIYRSFAAQTEKLAQIDIDTLRLEAGNKYTAHMVAINEQRLQNLQVDVNRQQEQARQVANAQQQAQQQAVSLTTDLRASNNQLDAVKQKIQQLEAQTTSTEIELPSVAAPNTTPPAAASSTAPMPSTSP